MASRFVLPFADVGNGLSPSSGAQLFFFETGTSTPKDTYTTETAATPNANPVIADSKGLFPNIFITGKYKVVLKDKNGSQKWAADPVDEFLTSVEAGKSIGGFAAYEFETVAKAKTGETIGGGFVTLKVKDVIKIKDRSDSTWDVITGSGTANTWNIITDGTLSFVLRPTGNKINSTAWGLVGGVDETTGLQSFYQYSVDNDYEGILAPLNYQSSGAILNEASAKNFNINCPIGVAVITITDVIDRVVRMDEAISFRHHNVDYDLDSNAAAGIFVRSTASEVNLGDVNIINCGILNAAQTTQLADAVSIDVGGEFKNINIDKNNIDGVSRVDTARFCNGILITGTTGIVSIKRNKVFNVTCPTNFFDADGITIFGKQNATSTALDTGKCIIEDNNLKDCRGRFIKSQHSNTSTRNNKGFISDSSVLITNWRFIDFQTSNGTSTGDELTYGSGVTADGGGSVSTAFVRFANKKDVTPTKVSICTGGILKTQTVWSQVVLSEIENGHTSVKVYDNDFGQSNITVLHDGDTGDFTESYYVIHDNTIECKVQLFNVTSDQDWANMFVSVTDNENIDSSTGHFRQVFPLGGTFSLQSNFVVRGNSRMIERVEWVFDFNRLTQGNAFQHGAQLNTNRPFSGIGFTQFDGFVITEIPENNLARWQRVLITVPDTFSSWRSVVYS